MAVLPVDLCLESYGAAVHVVDSLLSSGFYLRLRNRMAEKVPGSRNFEDVVRVSSGELCFEQAQALWLVDVCGCSYDEAALEARTGRQQIASRVAGGRQLIRQSLETSPVAAG